MRVRLDSSLREQLRHYFATSEGRAEFGGNLVVTPEGTLMVDPESAGAGKRKSVTVPSGPIMFHTHPADCKPEPVRGSGPCAIGVPSARDMSNIFLTAVAEIPEVFRAHVVFSHDGWYVVRVPADARRALQASICQCDYGANVDRMCKALVDRAGKDVYERLRRFEVAYNTELSGAQDKAPYRDFVHDWLRMIQGFEVAGVVPFEVQLVQPGEEFEL